MNAHREPLEVERLVTADQRRVTVSAHAEWREVLAAENRPDRFDEIDQEVEKSASVAFPPVTQTVEN